MIKNNNITIARSIIFLIVVLALFLVINPSLIFAISPSGANINPVRTETAPNYPAGNHTAQAGNVTELNIFGYSSTQSWQGYFGNVSGTIQLADANNRVLYNWSLANPAGEIYASTNRTIFWTNVQCFNFTATGTFQNEAGNGGTTNLHGINLTMLESMFNISDNDVDGVDETFNLGPNQPGTHDTFYTANLAFEEGKCVSTRLFSSAGKGEPDKFEEVLLYEPTTASIIFTSLLEKGSVAGFDGNDYDFQMLVLENGHGTNTETTTYYFFVEIE